MPRGRARRQEGCLKTLLGLVVVLTIALAGVVPSAAQPLDPASSAALAATLGVLRDPAQRAAAVAGSPEAAALDKQLQSVIGTPELQQELYSVAAEVFAELVQASGGDLGKITQALEAGRTDPGGFMARLSPRTVERLRAFSSKIAGPAR